MKAFTSEGFNIERRGRSGLARDWRRRNRRRRLNFGLWEELVVMAVKWVDFRGTLISRFCGCMVVLLLTHIPMTFGENIRQWRLEQKIGLRRFAKIIGLSPTFVSKMERGTGPLPGEEAICRMAKFFGKDPDVLLALADKVAADVLAVIIRQPAYARFIRATAHLTKEQWQEITSLHLVS